MDSSAVNVNVTVDDFDCILSYDRQSDWTTPDPSKSTFDATGSDWLRGTWHRTEVKNTAFHINFTGAFLAYSLTYCSLQVQALPSIYMATLAQNMARMKSCSTASAPPLVPTSPTTPPRHISSILPIISLMLHILSLFATWAPERAIQELAYFYSIFCAPRFRWPLLGTKDLPS